MPTYTKILRWVAVLPVAFLTSVILYFIIVFANGFFSDVESWNMKYFAPIQSSFVSGIGFIYAGVLTAPSHKKQTALALVGLVIFCTGAFSVIQLMDKQYIELIKLGLTMLGCIVGYLIPQPETE